MDKGRTGTMSKADKVTDRKDVISTQDMKEALRRSGYLIEQRVEGLLRERGYYVQTNAAYPDEVTGKSRELDIWALRAYRAGPEEPDFLFLVLLCECANNPQPVVFLTKEAQVPSLHTQDLKISGLPAKIWDAKSEGYESLAEFLGLEKYHHYCEDWVSTQYCTFQRMKKQPNERWFALHQEEQHDGFTVLRMAVDMSIREHYDGWQFEGNEPVNVQVYYPVLVLGGPLYEAYIEDSRLHMRKLSRVCFRLEHRSAQRHDQYQIDVVQEKHFPRYLDVLENETERMARLMRRRRSNIRESIETIVSEARDQAGKSARELLEW